MSSIATPRDLTMSFSTDPMAVSATVTASMLGAAGLIRYGIKLFFRDRVDVSRDSATNDVIQTLRDEVARLALSVATLSQVNVEVRDERDRLRTEVKHLTYAVNSIKDVLIEILGEGEALRKLKERGIEHRPPASIPENNHEDQT